MLIPMDLSIEQNLRSPKELLSFLLEPIYHAPEYDLASITYRQSLVKLWKIPRKARVLEIGCGQGDFTVVVADAVGPEGRVVAIDPADPSEGHPSIGQAQAHVKASPVGPQIEFVRTDAVGFLRSTAEQFDYIIIVDSLFYFSGPATLRDIASLAADRASRILIAEFAVGKCRPAAVPHLLTVLAHNVLESFLDGTSHRNVHCALTPPQIISTMGAGGWVLGDQKTVQTQDEYNYGWREAMFILKATTFQQDVESLHVGEKIKSMLLGMRDAVISSVDMLPGGVDSILNLDIWVGQFAIGGRKEAPVA